MSAVFPTKLLEASSGGYVDAELHSRLEFTNLIDAEQIWGPERLEIVRQCYLRGANPPEHGHWRWVHKVRPDDIGGALSPLRLMGVKGPDTWQGLVLATCVGHTTKLSEGGKDLVYVKFAETAPWNLSVPEIGQKPRYRGVGRQLMELCVRLSIELELKGRVGLHALPQADGFYQRCGLTAFDTGHQGLRYFEMAEDHVHAFLNPSEE